MKQIYTENFAKKIIKAILFLIIFLILFILLQRLLTVKVVKEFNEDKNLASEWAEYNSIESQDLDVLFIGTSHVYYGIDPMYIYENSGITSFDLCLSSSHFESDYLLAYEGLKSQNPKALFLDMSAIHYDKPQKEAKARMLLDQLPLSSEKIKYVIRRGDDDINLLSVVFPLLYYHSRWDDLTTTDFKYITGSKVETYTRGHYVTYKTKKTSFHFYEEGGEIGITEQYGWPDLVKIRDICEEQNVELILFKVPSPSWHQTQSDAAYQIAAALGVTFWDLSYEIDEIGLDTNSDFRDEGNHMNQYGAEKLSTYLMNFLMENFTFEDKRGKDQFWDDTLIEYNKLKTSKLS